MTKDIKAIIFDQGGVLMPSVYSFDTKLLYNTWENGLPDWVNIPKEIKTDKNEFLIEMAKFIRSEYEIQSHKSYSFNAIQSLSRYWKEKTTKDISYQEIGVWVMLLSQLESQPLYSNVETVFRQLHSKGIKLSIVSNNLFFGTQHRFRINKLGITNLLSCLIYSSELGLKKPSEIPFEIACKLMNIPYSQTISVGDKYETDGIAAEKLGIRFFCLSTENQIVNYHSQTISSLNDLLNIID